MRTLQILTTIALIASLCHTIDAAQKKVLIITIDGCRPDALLVAKTPNMDKLWQTGAYSFLARTDQITVSGPSFTSMLTGVWHDKHKVISNDYTEPNHKEYPHFFHRVKQHRPQLMTASIVWWHEIHLILQDGDADELVVKMDDQFVTDTTVATLTEKDPDVLFVHLNDVDAGGHNNGYGPEIRQYLDTIETSDRRVGQILKALYARKTYGQEDWLIMITTDHGGVKAATGNKTGTHGADTPQERTVFIIAHGPSVTPGEIYGQPAVVDVAVTALAHLDIPIDKSWNLDGRVVALKSTDPK